MMRDILGWAYSAVFNRFKREEAGWPCWVEPSSRPSFTAMNLVGQGLLSAPFFSCYTHHSKYPRQMLQHRQNTTVVRVEPVLLLFRLMSGHKNRGKEEEGPFRSLTRPMSLVVRAAITSNVTAAAASGNKVVKWLLARCRLCATRCCWQQKLLKRLFTQPDFLQNLRVTKILVLSTTTTSSVFVGRSFSFFLLKNLALFLKLYHYKKTCWTFEYDDAG